MSTALPPTIDPIAAARWQARAPAASPWLHEEVARRMQERLQWMAKPPTSWLDWAPVRGGLQGHGLVAERYPQAQRWVHEPQAQHAEAARKALGKSWWDLGRWAGKQPRFGLPAAGEEVQMLWANMHLHQAADPQALLAQWLKALAVDGFVMFSCLGPDTAQELHSLYQKAGWPPAGHSFTDMHDLGDMMVQGGFAEPVMDMEHITLTFATPERLLQELRELGCNLHPQRFAALRGKAWRRELLSQLDGLLRVKEQDGQLALTFEVVYGHAYKPMPRVRASGESSVALDDMRAMLRQGRNTGLR
ncbi:MAG: biotin synthase [Acidovorax sp.]|jgi:malonyl-CoA O-methyltransferase|nr:biotin synthase [Acidovorax sp.]MDR3004858.1 biotin synthase [Acidovorax sp.]